MAGPDGDALGLDAQNLTTVDLRLGEVVHPKVRRRSHIAGPLFERDRLLLGAQPVIGAVDVQLVAQVGRFGVWQPAWAAMSS